MTKRYDNIVPTQAAQLDKGVQITIAGPHQVSQAPTITATPEVLPIKADKNPQPSAVSSIPNKPQSLLDITVASRTHHPTVFPALIISSSTLLPSSTTTISNTPIALLPGDSSVIIGSSTLPLPTLVKILNLGSSSITANPAGASIIAPSLPAITVSKIMIPMQRQGSSAVINDVTNALAPVASTIAVGGHTFTSGIASGDAFGSSALIAGGSPITLSGTKLSLAPDATALIVNSSTQLLTLTPAVSAPISTLVPKILSFAGSTYTANPGSSFEIAGQTRSPGSAITVSGTPISLLDPIIKAVVGSSTDVLAEGTMMASVILAGSRGQVPVKGTGNGSGNGSVVFIGEVDGMIGGRGVLCVTGMIIGLMVMW